MSYFTETFTAILEKKNDDYTFADAMKDSSISMLGTTRATQFFSTVKYLTYKDSKGTKYEGAKAFDRAQYDYMIKHGGEGIKNIMARSKALDEFDRKCKEANKKEEYNLNKILGL